MLTYRLATAPRTLTEPLGALEAVATLLQRSEQEEHRKLSAVLTMIAADLTEGVAEVAERLPR